MYNSENSTPNEYVTRCGPKLYIVTLLALVLVGGILLNWPEVTNSLTGGVRSRLLSANHESMPRIEELDLTIGTNAEAISSRWNDEWEVGGNSPAQEFLVSPLHGYHGGARLLRVQGPGRCWNPHPGPFRTWIGQQNGCFVQNWRQWQDGCTHFQWFNSCANQWDPQIYWTYCVH